MKFTPHPKADERRESAGHLVKVLLGNRGPKVLASQLRELLTILLWKLTEAASSKYKTRYQSRAALDRSPGNNLHHEHVYQRLKMIDALLEAAPDQIDETLALAVGCTVTQEKASRLLLFDTEYGWERYRKAGIEVVDTAQEPAQSLVSPA